MALIDTTAPAGQRVLERLQTEPIAWLTTVGESGTPHPRPVWFFWEDATILVYSEPDTAKLRHIAANPRVSVNLNSDAYGGEVVFLTGTARVEPDAVRADAHAAYVAKYRQGIAAIQMTPESFGAAYRVAIRIVPDKVTAW